MSPDVFLLTISIPLVTVLLIFAMKYFSAVQQAKSRLASDDAYRQLAAQASAAQAEANARLASMESLLAAMHGRVAAVEKMLKEVE